MSAWAQAATPAETMPIEPACTRWRTDYDGVPKDIAIKKSKPSGFWDEPCLRSRAAGLRDEHLGCARITASAMRLLPPIRFHPRTALPVFDQALSGRQRHEPVFPSINGSAILAPHNETALEREICLMTNEEKTSMKAACLQAATTLIAARDSIKGAVDVDECVKLAAELYCRVTTTNWHHDGT